MNPFDFVKTINDKSNYLIDDENKSHYSQWLTNKALSYHKQTILYSNELNINNHIDNKMHYDYCWNKIPKGKRFSKWAKPDENENIEFIQKTYGYNLTKAKAALKILGNNISKLKEIYGV